MFCLPDTARIPEWFDDRSSGSSISFWLRCKLPSIPLFCTSQWMDIKNASSALYSPMAIIVLLMIHLIIFQDRMKFLYLQLRVRIWWGRLKWQSQNYRFYSIDSPAWTLCSCAFFNSFSSNQTMHSFDDIVNDYSMINSINADKGRQDWN
jgi:hypothetical protein